MKTQHELKYEELITELILIKNYTNYSQLDLFMDFHRNQHIYYDIFCDALYTMACGDSSYSLWLTPSGKPYLAEAYRAEEDLMVLSQEDVPVFEDDLKEQLDAAIVSMQKLLKQCS